jgi:hypothetical protein
MTASEIAIGACHDISAINPETGSDELGRAAPSPRRRGLSGMRTRVGPGVRDLGVREPRHGERPHLDGTYRGGLGRRDPDANALG